MLNQKQVRHLSYPLLTDMKAVTNVTDNVICYCTELETLYEHITAGSTLVPNDQDIIQIGSGDERWKAIGGKYAIFITDILYADLVTAIGASTLVEGSWYRITDYQTKHLIPNSDLAGNTTIHTGLIEPLIVLATSNNSITQDAYTSGSHATFVGQVTGMTTDVTIAADNPGTTTIELVYNAGDDIADMIATWNTANPTNKVSLISGSATQLPTVNMTFIDGVFYPYDIIRYDYSNAVCEDLSTPRNGFIIYRYDLSTLNYTYYDFRECTFRRYELDATTHDWSAANSYVKGDVVISGVDGYIYIAKTTIGVGGADPSTDATNWAMAVCFLNAISNKLLPYGMTIYTTAVTLDYSSYSDYKTFSGLGWFQNSFEPGAWDNVLFNSSYTKIGVGCISNTFFSTNDYNELGQNVNSCIFGYMSGYNKIGADSGYITFALVSNYNTIGYNSIGNVFSSSDSCIYGPGCVENIIQTAQTNTAGFYFNGNVIGDGSEFNTFGSNFQSSFIGEYFVSNKIGDGCTGNVWGDNCNFSTYGDNITSCLFPNLTERCKIEQTTNADFSTMANMTYLNFENPAGNDLIGVDFTSATIIPGNYGKVMFRNANGDLRIRFVDATDNFVITNVNA